MRFMVIEYALITNTPDAHFHDIFLLFSVKQKPNQYSLGLLRPLMFDVDPHTHTKSARANPISFTKSNSTHLFCIYSVAFILYFPPLLILKAFKLSNKKKKNTKWGQGRKKKKKKSVDMKICWTLKT